MSSISGPRIAIVSLGSRGDVQPFLALGRALEACGAKVVIVTTRDCESLVIEHGLAFRPVDIDVRDFLLRISSGGVGVSKSVAMMRASSKMMLTSSVDAVLDAVDKAVDDADVVVASGTTWLIAAGVAGVKAKPRVLVQLQPFIPSRHIPPYFLTSRDMGPLNKALWGMTMNAGGLLYRTAFAGLAERYDRDASWWRASMRTLLFDSTVPKLCGWSASVLALPADYPGSAVQVGFLRTSASSGLSERVEAFLEAGPAPVLATLGSMASVDGSSFVRASVGAARAAGRRLIIGRGWLELAEVEDRGDVLVIDSEPYDVLFPRCAAVIHHAGAGTTQTAAAAGVPQVPVPVMLDQPLWAATVRQLGVGGDPLPAKHLDVQRLTGSLHSALQPEVAQRARALASRMAHEPDAATVSASLILQTAGV